MTDETDPRSPDLVHECDLDEAPEKVWRALVEPELVERWLTQREPGLDCELTWQDPGREARYALNEADGETSEVRFRIDATEAGGTRLRIEQARTATAEVIPFPRRAEPVDDGGQTVSEVRFRIDATEAGGTRLRIEQARTATAEVIPFPRRAEPVDDGGQTVMSLRRAA